MTEAFIFLSFIAAVLVGVSIYFLCACAELKFRLDVTRTHIDGLCRRISTLEIAHEKEKANEACNDRTGIHPFGF